MSEIKSNENNFLIFFRNENYKQYQIKNDIIRLEDFYRNNGFRDIKISSKSEFINKKNKFNVYFYVNEGKKYQFGLLDFDFNSIDISLSQKEEIKSILENYYSNKIKKDNIYNRSSLDKMESLLSVYFYENGTIFFNIRVMDKIDDSKVDILLKAESIQPKYVNQINIFGKCHHSWCYYPTKVKHAQMHPNLKIDLLGQQIEACHEINVKAPIYLTVGWSAHDAETHPEWCRNGGCARSPDIAVRHSAAGDGQIRGSRCVPTDSECSVPRQSTPVSGSLGLTASRSPSPAGAWRQSCGHRR